MTAAEGDVTQDEEGAAAVSIEVQDESGHVVDGEPIDGRALVALARFVLDRMRVHPQAELSIMLYDVAAMESLHVQWMDEPGPTDVMSFPMDELRPPDDEDEPEPGLLGDVVICPEVAERQGREAGHGTEAELDLLLTHGVLHLLGYDHGEADEEREMFELQRELIAGWREAGGRRGAPETVHPVPSAPTAPPAAAPPSAPTRPA